MFVTDSKSIEKKMREKENENDEMREFCLSLFFAIGGVVEEFV